MELKTTDYTGHFAKLREILLKKTQPRLTNEEALAAEEQRLGVKIEVIKQGDRKDG